MRTHMLSLLTAMALLTSGIAKGATASPTYARPFATVPAFTGVIPMDRDRLLCMLMRQPPGPDFTWWVQKAGGRRMLPRLGRRYQRYLHSSLTVSPDGRRLAWLDAENRLMVHDLWTDRSLATFTYEAGFGACIAWISSVRIAAIPTSWSFAKATELTVFDVSRRVRTMQGPVTPRDLLIGPDFAGPDRVMSTETRELAPGSRGSALVTLAYTRIVDAPRRQATFNVQLPKGYQDATPSLLGDGSGLL